MTSYPPFLGSSVKSKYMKGISPVVATLLLIGITIAAVVLVWGVMQKTARPGNVVKVEVIGIEATAAPDAKSCSFIVSLRNAGNVPVTIKSVTATVGSGTSAVTVTLKPQNYLMSPGSTQEFSGEGTSNNPIFTDGASVKITIKYVGPDGAEKTIVQYATIRASSF